MKIEDIEIENGNYFHSYFRRHCQILAKHRGRLKVVMLDRENKRTDVVIENCHPEDIEPAKVFL